MAAISASVSSVAYGFYALAVVCACSDQYFEEPIAAIGIEKFILVIAYFGYACSYLIYYYMNQGKCSSPLWTLAVVVLYIVVMVLSCVMAPERENATKKSSLPMYVD